MRRLMLFSVLLTAVGCHQPATQVHEPAGDPEQAAAKSASAGKPGGSKVDPVAKPRTYVMLRRVPEGGIQPQALNHKGILHLIYFKGDPRRGDIFYVASRDDGKTFSKPLRVNSEPGSAVAVGNIRGAQMAVSYSGRVHVAWMGSQGAKPAAPDGATPMLYARLNDAKDAFEPQRNLIQKAVGLDGGGSITASGQIIQVYWHAPLPGTQGEHNRRIWTVGSGDDGATFGKEWLVAPLDTGVCGCCGIRAFVAYATGPAVLYRSARDGIHRDMYLLKPERLAGEFKAVKLHAWETGTCPMSTAAFVDVHNQSVIAWETDGQIWMSTLERGPPGKPQAAPGPPRRRKHPALAFNGRGILLAWTEGMGWNRGGKVAWQLYDSDLKAVDTPPSGPAARGEADGVPVWSLVAAVPLSSEQFLIFY